MLLQQGWSQQGGPAPSRGELPVKFVEGSTSPLEYLATVDGNVSDTLTLHRPAVLFTLVPCFSTKYTSASAVLLGRRHLSLQLYPGFNLMCADLRSRQLAYLCNRGTNRPEPVTPGLHGVTNGRLDAHWAKVDEGKVALGRLLAGGAFRGGHVPWGEVRMLLNGLHGNARWRGMPPCSPSRQLLSLPPPCTISPAAVQVASSESGPLSSDFSSC